MIVIDTNGNIRTATIGEKLPHGTVIVQRGDNITDDAELKAQLVDANNTPQDITDDVARIFAALEEGQDPTQIDDAEAPAAGGALGSALAEAATIERIGSETIATTDFDTTGFESLGLSQTQSLALSSLLVVSTGASSDANIDRPTVSTISSSEVAEGETATFDVTLSNASTTATTVTLTLAGDSATAGTDFTNTSVTITYEDGTTATVAVNADGTFDVAVPADDTTFSVSVATTEDAEYEGDETFTLSGQTATQASAVTGTATITDDGSNGGTDDRPTVSTISSSEVAEGETATFDVTLSNASTTATTVTLTLAGDSATAGTDFTNTSVTITYEDGTTATVAVNADGTFDVAVPADDTTFSVSVATTEDAEYEGDETFTLSGQTATQASAVTGTATITDDGSNGGTDDRPTVSTISSSEVAEGETATFDVTLSNASTTATTVTLTLAGDSATAGTDFTNTSVTITYEDGTTATVAVNADGTFDVAVPADDTTFSVSVATTEDAEYEGDETFTLSGQTATQASAVTGTATITDDGSNGGTDDRPTVSTISSSEVAEGETATFDVTLSNASTTATTVTLTLAGDSATAGTDFTNTSVTITYEDGTTATVAVNADGTFDVAVPADDTTFSVSVATTEDAEYEGDETFTLSGQTATQASAVTGTATITDDGSNGGTDDRPTVSTISSSEVAEGETATFDVTLSNASTTATTVTLTLAGDSATAGTDFTNTSVTITYEDGTTATVAVNADGTFDVAVPADDTTFSVSVATTEDAEYEGDETFTLSGQTATQASAVTGTATITDDGSNGGTDDRPTVSTISSSEVAEGETATFDVTLSNASTTATTVTLTLAGDSATAGTDFTNTSVTITYEDGTTATVAVNADGTFDVAVPADDTTFSVSVATTEDAEYEGDETFTLSGQTATQASAVTGTATITDDGSNGGTDDRPTVSTISSSEVAEGETATFDVTLSNASTTATTVTLTLAGDSATAGTDFTNTSVTITYEDGTTATVAVNADGTFDVAVPADDTTFSVSVATTEDAEYEGDETFTLSGQTATQASAVTGTATITDDGSNGGTDDRPTVSTISSSEVAEGETATFDVTLSNASTTATTVTLTLAGDSATAGTDFTNTSVTITYEDGTTATVAVNADGTFDVAVPADDTTFSVSVATTEDAEYEGDETFTLSGQTATQASAVTGTATITDDGSNGGTDDRPTVSTISSSEVAEGETATFDVTLSNASTTATTVTLTLAGDSATAGTDFTNTSVTITYEDGTTATVAVNADGTFDVAVPADDTTFSVSVATTEDAEYEGDETFTLSGQTATQASAVTGTATITDDGSNGGTDDRPTVSTISSSEVAEGETATFDVTLSNASTTATTVTLTLAGDSATAGTDFTNTSVTITYEDGTTATVAVNADGTFDVAVPADDTTFSVSVATTEDAEYEGDETFTLSGQTATQASAVTGTATITDDGSNGGTDDRPTVSTISSSEVAEGETATFDVTLSNASTTATTVTLTLAGDSATAGTDFTNTSVTITYEDGTTATVAVNADGTFDVAVPADDTTFSVSVATTEDAEYEGDETFTLSGQTATQASAVTGTATITDDGSNGGTDDRPTVSTISSSEVAEGETATFDVTLSNASTTATTVTLTLAGDSATAGTDFTNTSVTITYEDGTTATVAVNADGTFDVAVPADDTTFSVSVATTEDAEYEGDETFTLSGQTATQASAVTGTATITDDGSNGGTDDRPTVSTISSSEVAEGETATFDVTLSNASTTATTVTLTLAGDSATAGTDFTNTSVTITYEDGTTATVAVNADGTFDVAVPADDTTFSVSVATTEDAEYEGDETFTLSGQTATQASAVTGTATITDDGSNGGTDDRPTVSTISSSEVAEGETATFDVTLSNASTTATTVTLTLAGDSATAGTDFTNTSVTITYEDGTTATVAVNADGTFDVAVPADDTTFSVSVATTEDAEYEGDETFTLSGQTATQASAVTGTATITDDGSNGGTDDRPTVSTISSSEVAEGETATFDVTLSNASTTATTVTLTLAGDSATAGTDFTNTSVTITYEDGTTATVAVNADGTFDVAVPADDTTFSVSVATTEDAEYEGDETFTLSGQTATQASAVTGTATITDDGSNGGTDDRPTVSTISSSEVAEGETATFDVTLSNASTTATTVTLTLAGDSATAGTDFTNTSVTITYEDGTTATVAVNADGTFDVAVPADDTTFSVSVATTEDAEYEGDETFTLSGQTATQASAVTGTATITDDGSNGGTDDRPTVSTISSSEVAEGETATFDVTLSNASTTATTVTLTLAGDSATAGTDFTNTSVTITYEDGTTATVAVNADGTFDVAVPADDTTFSVSVATTEDAEYEGDETFTLSGQTATQASAVTGTATITDDGSNGGTDDRPTVSTISSSEVAEGETATFDVTLSNASTTATTVTLTLAGDSATAGTDFTNTSVTITYEDGTTATVAVNADGTFDVAVPADDTTFSVSVATTEDAEYEGDETFTLSGQTATQASAVTGTATITDDGSNGGTDDRPTVSTISSSEVAEGETATFDVTLSNASTTATTVTLTLAGDSATAGTDFTNTSVTITYEDGTTATVAVNADGTFDVAVPADDTTFSVSVATTEDAEYEGDETFTLSGQTATQASAVTGTATITDDGSNGGTDDRPTVSTISSSEVAEGETATFDVTLSNASTTATTVTLTLAGDSATAGTDFTNTSVTITYEDGTTATVAVNADGTFDVAVPADDTTFSVSVATTEDAEYEGDETFTLSGQTATQASAVTGTATITDDGSNGGTDDRPTVSTISSSEVAEGETATFDVTLSNASTTATTVTLTLAGDSATAGTDFTNTSVTITYEDGTTATVAVNADGTFDVAVPADDTTFSVSVATTEDAEYEGDETFTLSGQTATQASAVTGTATITDDGSNGGTDDRPTVSTISSSEVAEGETATFDVTLSNASTTATTVTLTLAGDSATAGTDFTNTSVTITYEDGTTATVAVNADGTFDVAVPADDTTFSVSVATTEDAEYEGDETFTLSGQTATQASAVTGTATITDDGSNGGTDDRPTVSTISSSEVAEGETATFDVTLSNASTTATTVTLTLAGDSATAGTDFTNTSVTITYEDGTTATVAVNADGTFDVAVPADDTTFSVSVATTEDAEYEGDETFTLSGQTATQASAVTGTATITDDGSNGGTDDRPTVSTISSSEVAEGETATFDVTLSNASTTATTVTLTLAGDSATAARTSPTRA
ncbi:Calx-beta domain-containing protein [Vibrio fluvialis]|uniref:Calx-beta domain-containing protein n=1 Tax=Vibrio fluvialis TaxID=676 RepID=UPI001558CA55|nr:Calx-beta domain-containing protein [Vibrio fluvialis]